jgi:hypothetical protein
MVSSASAVIHLADAPCCYTLSAICALFCFLFSAYLCIICFNFCLLTLTNYFLTLRLGNSFSDDERCIVAGYDNGDIKLFDLRANAIRYETNVANGEASSMSRVMTCDRRKWRHTVVASIIVIDYDVATSCRCDQCGI